MLADGFNMCRIYLPTFLTKLSGLVLGGPEDQNYFAFRLLSVSANQE
jgi:hypothetical protein